MRASGIRERLRPARANRLHSMVDCPDASRKPKPVGCVYGHGRIKDHHLSADQTARIKILDLAHRIGTAAEIGKFRARQRGGNNDLSKPGIVDRGNHALATRAHRDPHRIECRFTLHVGS